MPSQQDIQQLVGLCRGRRFDEASALADRFTRKWPQHPIGWQALATCAQARGDLKEAIRGYRKALEIEPTNADSHNNLGLLLAEREAFDEAVKSYRRAIRLRPGFVYAHYNMGLALEALGRLEEAADCHRSALELQPDFAEASNHLGNVLRGLGHQAESEQCYRRVLELQPQYAEVHGNLGNLLAERGAFAEAETCMRRAVELRPDYAEGLANLGNLLRNLGRLTESERALRRALDLHPGDAGMQANLAATLLELGQGERAVDLHRQVLERQPRSIEAHENLGNALADMGQPDSAATAYRDALSLEPTHARAWYHLSLVKRFGRDDSELASIEQLLASEDLDPQDRIYLEYAAGKAWADIGDEPEQAFAHYSAGARLRRQSRGYDVAADEEWLHSIARAFPRDRLESSAGTGHSSARPVFIVGMPRSGTTLVEQMMASHPSVHGAGERPDLGGLIELLNRGKGIPYPGWVEGMAAEELERLGREYCHTVSDPVADANRVTDKMPGNFAHVGLLRLALPNARVIHVQRDPADTCVSCFTYLFSGRQEFTYDLRDLGRYYRAYHELMRHWREVVPGDFLMEVQYEALVEDPNTWIDRMLQHCGLEWDDACLQFHRAERTVRTASADQVRQPLYRSAIGRWKQYRAHLGPLFEALGPLAPDDCRR